jgi:hypothetical protein
MPESNDGQLQTPTPMPTTKAAPSGSTDEKQPAKVSHKWKIVAMALAAILAAILFLGLIAFLSCGWLVLDLLDRDQV